VERAGEGRVFVEFWEGYGDKKRFGYTGPWQRGGEFLLLRVHIMQEAFEP